MHHHDVVDDDDEEEETHKVSKQATKKTETRKIKGVGALSRLRKRLSVAF